MIMRLLFHPLSFEHLPYLDLIFETQTTLFNQSENDLTSILLPVMNFNHHWHYYEKILHLIRLEKLMLYLLHCLYSALLQYVLIFTSGKQIE